MLYNEYLKCAEKHLIACENFLMSYQSGKSSDFDVFLDIFYISGYVLEGLTIYSAYKINGWPAGTQINDLSFYDSAFFQRTNLDFFNFRSFQDAHGRWSTVKNRGLKVQGHNFQEIANALLINQGPFANDNTTPYFGRGNIDPDVLLMINLWNPEVRYYHVRHQDISRLPTINYDRLSRLVKTCKLIFLQTISKVGI